MLMTEEPRRRLSFRSNNLVFPDIDPTPTIRAVPVRRPIGPCSRPKPGPFCRMEHALGRFVEHHAHHVVSAPVISRPRG
jgi:hypothetical protein